MKRKPLLQLLQTHYPDYTKDRLLAAVLCGEVRAGAETVRDPKRLLPIDTSLELVSTPRYASRGGDKLEHALRAVEFAIEGRVFLDAGSSTGGFTDCLLQHGARVVHAVDVGYNQLEYRLRQDERVVVHERTNISAVTELKPQPDRAVADLSFRSLLGITGHILDLTRERLALVLCKPQFERQFASPASRESSVPRARASYGSRDARPPRGAQHDEFDGVVRNSDQIVAVVERTVAALEREGVMVPAAAPSVVSGRAGNREVFLLVARPSAEVMLRFAESEYRKRRDAAIAAVRDLLG